MKLPDFRKYEPLNRLKEQMGIPRDQYGDISVVVKAAGLTRAELEKLTIQGIDIRREDLEHNPDGTVSYKGNRVLLYIRDVTQYGSQRPAPKYHLATCRTIDQMNNQGRGQRYVVSTRTDGSFSVNINSSIGRRAVDLPLQVCKHCLEQLDFDGFSRLSLSGRKAFVDSFLPERFFAKYPVSLHTRLPHFDSAGAPLNVYTSDFAHISGQAKNSAGWRCAACRADLSARELRRFLHVHHRDGNRWDNRPDNLRVLCIGCHAEEPLHAHLRGTPDYREYRRLRPKR